MKNNIIYKYTLILLALFGVPIVNALDTNGWSFCKSCKYSLGTYLLGLY